MDQPCAAVEHEIDFLDRLLRVSQRNHRRREDTVIVPIETPVFVEPQVEGVQRRHRAFHVVLERFLDPAPEGWKHDARLDTLVVDDGDPGVAILVFRSQFELLDPHQRGGIDALGDLAAEQRVQATRHDDRVEGRVGNEPVDPVADDRLGVAAVAVHLNAAPAELLVQVPGEGVQRLVVVVVDIDRLVAQVIHDHPFRYHRLSIGCSERRKLRRPLLEEARDPFDDVRPRHRLVQQDLGSGSGVHDVASGVAVYLPFDHRHRRRRTISRDVLRVVQGPLHQVFGRDDFFDEAQLGRLLSEEGAAAQQQVEGDAPGGQARKYPGDAELGDQSAASEHGCELGPGGREPDIAHQRLCQTDSDAGTVDGRDDGLAQRGHKMWWAFTDQVGQIRLTRLLHRLADLGGRTRRAQIRAGAEPPAPTGQHDHPDGRVLFGAVDRGVKPGGDVGAPGVEPLRAIAGEDRDAARRGLVEHRVFGSTVATGHLPRYLLAHARRIQPTLYPYCIPIGTAFYNCGRGAANGSQTANFGSRRRISGTPVTA